jgi:hypothetical protein
MNLQKIVLKYVILFVLLLSTVSTAFAHRDDGEYQILHARYGTAERNVDVTQTLRELAQRDRRFRVNNQSFAIDPHPYQKKTLRIYARDPLGQMRTFEYREGSRVDGDLFTAWGRGDWGRDGDYRGGWDGRGNREDDDFRDRRNGHDDGEYLILSARYGTYERNVDVTDSLKQLARRDREFRMGNASFGIDPHPRRIKTLRIYARGSRGEIRTFEYREGSVVDGALFKSWSRGDWGNRGDYKHGWGNRQDRYESENQYDDRDRQYSGRQYRDDQAVTQLIIHNAYYGIESRKMDVTAVLQSLVRDGQLEMRVENATTGGNDPAPGARKTLWVTYSLTGQAAQSVRVDERDWLNLR